ncbi:hypothetical protein KQI74_12410 [Paenibacillus barcinonensis]|uniref:hypothetical protein n=1 Tax=Paenibacillus barcinonensis TaxID=198119 RepID=UPI001C114556|nr:hypothetical protein [Paenibacillus barcinonensis]MBU5353095.1 hypothetical protein [Paenibacillus barcinonensis]
MKNQSEENEVVAFIIGFSPLEGNVEKSEDNQRSEDGTVIGVSRCNYPINPKLNNPFYTN